MILWRWIVGKWIFLWCSNFFWWCFGSGCSWLRLRLGIFYNSRMLQRFLYGIQVEHFCLNRFFYFYMWWYFYFMMIWLGIGCVFFFKQFLLNFILNGVLRFIFKKNRRTEISCARFG